MTHEALEAASRVLRQAATAAEPDQGAILANQADQLAELAARRRGPDHGRIARHQHALRHVSGNVGGEVAALIGDANDLLVEYRTTIEGV